MVDQSSAISVEMRWDTVYGMDAEGGSDLPLDDPRSLSRKKKRGGTAHSTQQQLGDSTSAMLARYSL